MSDTDLLFTPAAKAAALIRDRELSPVEYVDVVLKAIDRAQPKLNCFRVVMAEEAKIGYPPARVWGCPTTMMWVYRVGAERAKRLLFTGDLIDGREAERIGLITQAVPAAELDAAVQKLADRMKGVPKNQLWMQKTAINSAFENMGMRTTQTLATLFDGMTRHSPEGI